MAMSSYYSNWDTLQHEFNSDISSLSPLELFIDSFELPDAFCNNIDHLFENNDFYSENCNSLFPNLSTPPDYNPNSTIQEFEPFHYPKCQKTAENYQPFYSDFSVPEPGLLNVLRDYKPELIIPTLPDVPTAPPVYDGRSFKTVNKLPSDCNISAQSIAARQRRKKIREKTQELGKLLPGGNRMNTAEMFQSAYKYIKFLQAQVVILELMGSTYHKENESEELHGFLESRLVQEKLYSNEKCLVPQKFVQEIANDNQIHETKPQVVKELRQLANTNPAH